MCLTSKQSWRRRRPEPPSCTVEDGSIFLRSNVSIVSLSMAGSFIGDPVGMFGLALVLFLLGYLLVKILSHRH